MQDGTPFEAEYWTTKGTVGFNVVLPIKEFPKRNDEKNSINQVDEKTASREAEEGSITQFSGKYETQFYGILCGGMIDLGQETDDKIIEAYVEYICRMHLVRFTGQLYNGAVFYREDDAGQQLAEVRIALSEDDLVYAETDLTFRDFPGKKINHLKLVK
ncbi:MAG: hypothetical protein SPL49_09250 [Oribacterium sp.]|jgi:hypothetical protein|nr:hypothetical protein [Oribacterium sp.]